MVHRVIQSILLLQLLKVIDNWKLHIVQKTVVNKFKQHVLTIFNKH